MVDDMVYIVGLEFVQDRYYDGSVGKSSEKCDGPMRGVTAADGYFISFFMPAASIRICIFSILRAMSL